MSVTHGVAAVGSGSAWDHRRNTSQTQGVPPHALREALAACAALRRNEPALVKWIEDGHPHLDEAEHVARFGEPYRPTRAKRRT